ncbi:hypothetical protein EDC56_2890 [Sinobacterium caligoides]|uniref:Quercetin 2,3-dioxygenase n=1 Tax=Sinobacterium caligoides TaxID=933926 RepID=A0A3N2DKM2_9GAMM|nr:pirin family protein [Sinobacterium caligoides]ROS00252.1 hypothetical protein EDC56_2890 [Sinobacterium caligoides]
MNAKTHIASKNRQLKITIAGQATSDGDGVKLTRMIGTRELDMLDPFLMLDVFESDQALDYIGGFPSHPHRGFESVTYLLEGRMRHKDSAGNEGIIQSGGMQWITAGSGIIHSEMPEQENGMLAGFQLWVNLPRSHKMTTPKYLEFPANPDTVEQWESGSQIRVIAGRTDLGTEAAIKDTHVDLTYMDVQLQAGDEFIQQLPKTHHAFIYMIEGDVTLGERNSAIEARSLAILSQEGEQVSITAKQNSRFLLVAGQPLNEPVARGGPFVMNTKDEITQAFADYQSNRF